MKACTLLTQSYIYISVTVHVYMEHLCVTDFAIHCHVWFDCTMEWYASRLGNIVAVCALPYS